MAGRNTITFYFLKVPTLLPVCLSEAGDLLPGLCCAALLCLEGTESISSKANISRYTEEESAEKSMKARAWGQSLKGNTEF